MRTVLLLLCLVLLSTAALAQRARRVVAKRGDVVQTLLRRHGLRSAEHVRQFRQLNKARLGSKGLVAGRAYVLPPVGRSARNASKTKTAPAVAAKTPPVTRAALFGPAYARVQVRDQALRGAVYYLSSGHGGPDPGAIGQYGTYQLAEDEYAYDVTVRLAHVLLEHGATVYVMVQDPNDGIRDLAVLPTDYDEVQHPNRRIPLSQVQRLRQRIAEVNRLHSRHGRAYQRLLALHVDSRSVGQNIDVFFYHHPNNALGLRLARNIHKVFTSRYKRAQPNRPYSGNVSERGTLYEVRNSHAPAVFMELGNIRNQKDQRRFVVPDNRQALANWICEGLIADYAGRR
ncbi:N-acetylmuramoyl-L-alanine amidase family protein [Hymenobacter guriensis]|uniref:N-acetylmuramoyl-L-alanine amidase family protein n=1 Tax=Hymenobacter guriensis TaxID=2793065 RepID=UPI001E50CDB7|nr:N-acetylmuramoyl-L-alanine amidase [Hymenobacter guriensis]